jgi:hypothetical protein
MKQKMTPLCIDVRAGLLRQYRCPGQGRSADRTNHRRRRLRDVASQAESWVAAARGGRRQDSRKGQGP